MPSGSVLSWDYDAVIVGSGPNGLTAAARLARAGRKVVLFEAQSTIGGGVRSDALTLPGFVHDVCSTAHPFGVASPAFEQLRLQDHGLRWVHPRVPMAHPLGDDRAAVLDGSIDITAQSLGEDAGAWRAVHGAITSHFDQVRADLVGPKLAWPQAPIRMASFATLGLRPAAAVADRFKTEEARALFGGSCAHAIVPLEKPLTASFGIVLGAAGHAVGWPFAEGGSQSVADALVSIIRSSGGEVIADHPVDALDKLPRAPLTFLDVSPPQFARIADGHLSGRYLKACRQFQFGPGVFKVDFALDGPVPWSAPECAGAGTVHVCGTFEEIARAEREVSDGVHPAKPFVLVAQASAADPSRAPEGKHTVWSYCHVPNGSTVDMTSAVEAQIERFAPGFRDRILAKHSTTAAQREDGNANLVGGDIGGGSQAGLKVLTRPFIQANPYTTPIPGTYLCSASTAPGAGVHGMCGWHAVSRALKDQVAGRAPS